MVLALIRRWFESVSGMKSAVLDVILNTDFKEVE